MSTELTAVLLNDEIVRMRKCVPATIGFIVQKLARQVNVTKKKKTKSEQEKCKNERRIQRLLDEIHTLKHLNAVDVIKFALVNVKKLDELEKQTMSIETRMLYRVACHARILKEIDQFRCKYQQWPVQVPFLLQRLGAQYMHRRKTNQTNENTNSESVDDIDNGKSSKQIDTTSQSKDTKLKSKSAISQLVSTTIRSAVAKNKSTSAKKDKLKASSLASQVEQMQPTLNTAVIRKFNLDELFNGDDELQFNGADAKSERGAEDTAATSTTIDDPFFIGGASKVEANEVPQDIIVTRDIKVTQVETMKKLKRTRPDSNPTGSGSARKMTKVETKQKAPPAKDIAEHPSWAARKQQRVIAGGSKGKRTVFDDE